MRATITGWGAALPPATVTNADLAARLDTTEGWIAERTGIRERRVGGTTAGLAEAAARRALAGAGVPAADLDAVVLATTTPDAAVPATAAEVQARLGAGGAALDLNAACSGFVYALVVAFGLVAAGSERVLVVGAETLSRLVDWDDRDTAVLFADGAGAVVVEASDGPGALLAHELGNDPTGRHLITAPLGGHLAMDGREVFRRAVRLVADAGARTLDAAGLGPDDVDLVVPHQANVRILDAAAERLGIPRERWADGLATTGNTSAASIPNAPADAADGGPLAAGATVLLVGFGSGMSWECAALRWTREVPCPAPC